MALTDDQVKGFKSMAIYWKEVRGRDDKSPLAQEAVRVQRVLGVRILDLVEHYIELLEERQNTLRTLEKINDALMGKES